MSTPFLISEPFQLFHEASGAPLDNGFIYLGAANLDPQTNPLQAYWDAALTLAAVQPLRTMNGAVARSGAPSRVYVDATDYSVRVCNKNNTPVYSSLSNLPALPASAISGTISSANVSFLAVGTGGITRTVQAKLRDTVSVFDFMTTLQIADVQANTQTYDVTVPIQNAIDAADEVFFPAGTYKTTSALLINYSTGKVLRGAGSGKARIHNHGTGAAISVLGGLVGTLHVRISDLGIIGYPGATHGVLMNLVTFSTIERVEATGHPADGFHFVDCTGIDINSCWGHNNGGCGIAFGSGNKSCNVNNGEYSYNALDGILVSDESLVRPECISAVGVNFVGNTNANIELANCDSCSFVNCKVLFNFTSSLSAYGVEVSGTSTSSTFARCRIVLDEPVPIGTAVRLLGGSFTSFSDCYGKGNVIVESSGPIQTRFTNNTGSLASSAVTDNATDTFFTPPKQYLCANLPFSAPYASGRIAIVTDVNAGAYGPGEAVFSSYGLGGNKRVVFSEGNTWYFV